MEDSQNCYRLAPKDDPLLFAKFISVEDAKQIEKRSLLICRTAYFLLAAFLALHFIVATTLADVRFASVMLFVVLILIARNASAWYNAAVTLHFYKRMESQQQN